MLTCALLCARPSLANAIDRGSKSKFIIIIGMFEVDVVARSVTVAKSSQHLGLCLVHEISFSRRVGSIL